MTKCKCKCKWIVFVDSWAQQPIKLHAILPQALCFLAGNVYGLVRATIFVSIYRPRTLYEHQHGVRITNLPLSPHPHIHWYTHTHTQCSFPCAHQIINNSIPNIGILVLLVVCASTFPEELPTSLYSPKSCHLWTIVGPWNIIYN